MGYDVYYTTGGGPWINAGSDIWVNHWLEHISPILDTKPILMIHRNRPIEFKNFKFPIETHWQGDNPRKFNEICNGARRIHILHGHYTPVKCILDNKDKIYSNVLHNSVDYIIKSGMGSDVPFVYHPYMSSEWEREVSDWSKYNIWVGLFDIRIQNVNIPNFYEFKFNKELSENTNIGFAARPEGRKNPHYLSNHKAYLFTDSKEFGIIWKKKINSKKFKIYHYDENFKWSFYNLDWGISHSAFTGEPFGYSIFEAVDMGKLPIIHKTWCSELEYPYRASTKSEFDDIYKKIISTSYDERKKWFDIIKNYMIENFGDKQRWIQSLLKIYNN